MTAPTPAGSAAGEQTATARSFDPATGAAEVVLDDGTPLPCPRDRLEAAGIRLLRPGQRLRVRVTAGVVVAVALPAFPLPE